MPHSPRFLALVNRAKEQIQEMPVAELLPRLGGDRAVVLIDVREAHEYAAGHLPGAVHLSRGVLERDLESRFPDLDTPLVLYCGGGYRSALSAERLQTMGYRRVWSLAGGWRAWLAGGYSEQATARM
jgi:rhodanese-related sulfurtransferase